MRISAASRLLCAISDGIDVLRVSHNSAVPKDLTAFPDKERLDALLLMWLLQHSELQRRRDLVVGAAQLRSLPVAVRALPARRRDQQYPDLLHERLNYRV